MNRGGGSSGRNSLGVGGRGQAQQQFSFPLLNMRDILSCMADLQIPLAEEALTEPTRHKDAVRRCFEALVELCTDITREEMQQPAFSGLSALQYPELHEDSIPSLAFFRAVGKMMDVCGVRDFSIKDILEPSPKRLRRCLSACINFCKFREERLVLFTQLMDQRQDVMESLASAQNEKAQLEAELAALKEQTAQEAETIETEKASCEELQSEIAELNLLQATLKNESRSMKETSTALKEELHRLTAERDEVKASKEHLESQIVRSPARVRREMADVAASLEEERAEASNAEKSARDMAQCVANTKGAKEGLMRCMDILNDLAAEKERENEALSELEGVKASVEANLEKAAEGRVAVQSLQRQLDRFEEKLSHLRQHADMKREAAEEALNRASRELEAVRNEKQQTISGMQEVEAEARQLEGQIEAARRKHIEDCQGMMAAYRKLEAAVRKHNAALRGAMEQSGAENKQPADLNATAFSAFQHSAIKAPPAVFSTSFAINTPLPRAADASVLDEPMGDVSNLNLSAGEL